jgi:hypothetical protein
MLMRVTKFGALDGYPGLRKLMRSDPSLASVSIVELEGSGARVVGAWIDADAQVQPLSEGVRAYRSMHSKPELACGDDDTLSAAGFRIVRTLQLEDGGRRFREAP